MRGSTFNQLYQKNVSIKNFALVTIAMLFTIALYARPDLKQISNYVSNNVFTSVKKSPPFIENKTRIDSMELYNKSGLIAYEQFFDYIDFPVKSFCKNETNIGGKWINLRQYIRFDQKNMALNKQNGWYFDGNKIVCFDEEIFGNRNDCLVLSIGIDHDWTFDDAIIQYGCQVFAFDHTIGQREHIRNQNIYFYPYGASKTKQKTNKGEVIDISSMFDIMNKKLGKNVTELTYLKLDIEGAETEVLDYLLNVSPDILDKIQQIGMEIHPGKIDNFNTPTPIYKQYFDYFMGLEKRGFALFHSSMNPVPHNIYYSSSLQKFINGYYELVWAKWR